MLLTALNADCGTGFDGPGGSEGLGIQ